MEEEVVQGLREWLEKTGLLHLKAGIEAWAEEPCSFSGVSVLLSWRGSRSHGAVIAGEG